MQLIFWQGILSPLQAPYIRALAGRPGWNITVVAERAMTAERTAMGWAVPDLGQAQVIIPTANSDALSQVKFGKDAIHLLEGVRGRPIVRKVLPVLRASSARIGIISESADPNGFKGQLRQLIYRWDALRYGNDIDFVLAMGSKGVSWYQKCHFPGRKLYQFSYVTSPDEVRSLPPVPTAHDDAVTVGFLGSLILRKGGDLLLRALAGLREKNWRLVLMGDGECRSSWERLAADLEISDRTTFTGTLSNPDAKKMLGCLDLFVLPSRFDGWGAVVNEALMQGVPVLCSDRCGSRDLLSEGWRGGVFKADSVKGLAAMLSTWIGRGKRTAGVSERIRTWSLRIQSEAVADYFAEVIGHIYQGRPRPVAPWLKHKLYDECSCTGHD